MRQRISGGLIAVFFSVTLLVACAPKAAPVPSPGPVAPQVTPAKPALAAPTMIPEDAAWTKVVEAAKKEGKLIVYTTHFFGDVGIQITKTFAERTGIRVDLISAPGGTSVERIKTEHRVGSPVASVLTAAGTFVLIAKQDGLTQRVGDVPEVRDERIRTYDPWLDKDGHMLSLQLVPVNPWINTKLVQPGTEPTSWLDLLKPKWKGKIGIPEPDSAPSANYMFYGLTTRGRLDLSYFTELSKQDLIFQITTQFNSAALSRGDFPLSFVGGTSTNSMGPFLHEGAPIKAIDMAEGIVIYRTGGVALLQSAPHSNAGRVFINWLFSQEGQTIFHKATLNVGFRKDVPSFVPPGGQFTPSNPIMMTLEDELEIAKIQRNRTLSKILRGG